MPAIKRYVYLLISGFTLAACGADDPANSQAIPAKKPSFGQHCTPSVGCEAPLQCIDSDYAPEPWCLAPCDSSQVKNYCTDSQLGSAATQGTQGFCTQMPSGFAGPAAPMCLPICANLAQCKAIDSQWEACAQPSYKGLTFVKDLPTKVCQAPSAHGQIKVDPQTCDWQSKASDPIYAEAKNNCVALCKGFLKACQLWPKTRSEACCGWACFRYLTPGGQVDAERLGGEIKCYLKAFTAYQSTALVCTAWQDECPPLPDELQPAP